MGAITSFLRFLLGVERSLDGKFNFVDLKDSVYVPYGTPFDTNPIFYLFLVLHVCQICHL